MESAVLSSSTTKFLQTLDIYFFKQDKCLITRIVEYSKIHQSVCGDRHVHEKKHNKIA